MAISVVRMFRVQEELYDLINAYDDYISLRKYLAKAFKIADWVLDLQTDVLRNEYSSRPDTLEKQIMSIRLAGNIDNMKRGTVIRAHPDPYNAAEEHELAMVTVIGDTDEYGNKPVTFIGLTGMWAGLTLHSTKKPNGQRLFNMINKFRETGVIAAFSEVTGHVFELKLKVDDGRCTVLRAELPSRVQTYNRQLRAARKSRHVHCKSSCLSCDKRRLARAGETKSAYSVCCPLTGGRYA